MSVHEQKRSKEAAIAAGAPAEGALTVLVRGPGMWMVRQVGHVSPAPGTAAALAAGY